MKKLFLFLFIVSIFSFFSCSQQEKTKKEITEEAFLKKIDKARDSNKVIIMKTLRDSSCVKFQDLFGNSLKPDQYYWYINGHTVKKRFSYTNTESDFLFNHKKIITFIVIKSKDDLPGKDLKVELFDYIGDPPQMSME